MAGENATKEILNNTLEFVCKLLNINDFDNWFIGYGTLLGIIRENSCIDGDDDIDIIIDRIHYDRLKKVLTENGFKIEYGFGIADNRNILKTKETNECCSVDFYMASVDNNGHYYDSWENVIWSYCNPILKYKWQSTELRIPSHAETKLVNRYGVNYKTPQKSKGIFPRKKTI